MVQRRRRTGWIWALLLCGCGGSKLIGGHGGTSAGGNSGGGGGGASLGGMDGTAGDAGFGGGAGAAGLAGARAAGGDTSIAGGGRAGSADGGQGGFASGQGGAAGSASTAPVAFNAPACGKPLPGFAGTLCGPAGNTCRVLADEIVDPTLGYRTRSPALAVDSQGRPHIVYVVAEGGFHGFYSTRNGDGAWMTAQSLPTPVAGASLAIGPDDLPVALLNNGALATSLWKRSASGWQQLDDPTTGTDATAFQAYDSGGLIATQDGCFHAALLAPNEAGGVSFYPGHGLWNGKWNVTALGSGRITHLTAGLALAPDGVPHVALWKYEDSDIVGTLTGTLDWAVRGGFLEVAESDGGGASGPTRAFITVAQGGGETVPHILYRAKADADTTFPFPSKLVEAWRSSDGRWSRQTIATSSGPQLAYCDTVTPTSPPCNVDTTEVVPVAIVSSGSGSVRAFLASHHSKRTLTPYCLVYPASQRCEWQVVNDAGASPLDETTLEMAWRNDDGTVGRAELLKTQVSFGGWMPSVAIDVQGKIHVALYDRIDKTTVRYLQIGP